MVELLKLEIEGFGRFDKKKTINFKNGINFITGLNETGKSTILEAILASLFKYTNTRIEPFFCWTNGDVCKLTLRYKTDKGETFEIISDYKNAKKKLLKVTKSGISEISTTIDIIHQYIKEQFGFDEQKVFENTTFIRQSQMAILGDSTTKNKLRDMIEEVFVGSAEASATIALTKIKKVEKDGKKEIESLNEELGELREDLETAEEHKKSLTRDSSDYETVSKELSDKKKKFDELKLRKEKFNKKEEYQKEFGSLDKEIKNLDKTLSGVNESIKKRDKLLDKMGNYKGFNFISKEEFLITRTNIKELDSVETSLKTYAKSSGKKKIVQEKLVPKYILLFIIGLIFSVILIGIPIAIYAYKRMRTEVTVEKEDTENLQEINKLKGNKEELEQQIKDKTKKIKEFNMNTFVDLYGEYIEINNKIEGFTASIKEFIKTVLEKKDIGDNEEDNIKKINELKTDLLNKMTIVKNNLEKYKLVDINEQDLDSLQNLETEVKDLNNRQVELKASVNKTKELVKSPEEIQEEVNNTEQKIRDLLEKTEEHDLAYKFLEKAETEVQQKFTPLIEKNSKDILKQVTNNKYSELKLSEDTLDITIKAPEIKEFVPVEVLSQGAKDQIYFTIRTTMTDLLSGNINMPLIFDDPFHNFDDTRLSKTITAMKELARNKQIILISHKQYQKDFKDFADNIIEV